MVNTAPEASQNVATGLLLERVKVLLLFYIAVSSRRTTITFKLTTDAIDARPWLSARIP